MARGGEGFGRGMAVNGGRGVGASGYGRRPTPVPPAKRKTVRTQAGTTTTAKSGGTRSGKVTYTPPARTERQQIADAATAKRMKDAAKRAKQYKTVKRAGVAGTVGGTAGGFAAGQESYERKKKYDTEAQRRGMTKTRAMSQIKRKKG